MKFKINCSPYLKMHEITKKLFNRNFHSDVQFCVGDKIIYAHSLELIKRSVVFEKQLEDTMGEKKLIPINDCSYGSFYEFIRFIYTDECEINEDNGMELLKLAIKYKIIILENLVINLSSTFNWVIQLFELCVIEKYEIARNVSNQRIAIYFNKLLNIENLSSLHHDALSEALKFDDIIKGVTEVQIFNALARWIENYCKQNKITLTQGRGQFDDLIRQIRFPTMTNDEIRECAKKYPGLLSDNDLMSIGKQVLFGSDGEHVQWISKRRCNFNYPLDWRKINRDTPLVTAFLVLNDTILNGIWIGVEEKSKEIEIEITAEDIETYEIKKIVFKQSARKYWSRMLISLGESLVLKPNYKYWIAVKYLDVTEKFVNVICRNANTDLMLKDPDNSIQIMKASDNMLEMYFKSPPE